MVSGGTYGTEDIVHGAGYSRAILFLLLTPILWSLPTAFMIGELSEYPAAGRRVLRLGASRHGEFLGIPGGLALAGCVDFDMAIYPTLFVAYLTRMFPWFQRDIAGCSSAWR